MTPYVAVGLAFVLYAVAAWVSYHPTHKDRAWFPWVMGAISLSGGLMWAWAVRLCADRREVFAASVAWDAAVLGAYSVLPLVVFEVRLSAVAWAGFGLVVVGAILVKQG